MSAGAVYFGSFENCEWCATMYDAMDNALILSNLRRDATANLFFCLRADDGPGFDRRG